VRESATRAYLSRGLRPPIDGGEPRHCGRPKEVRPAPGTAHRAEQKARRQMGETFETPKGHLHDTQKQRTRLHPPKDLLQRDDLPPALYEPDAKLFCLLHS